MIKNTPAERKSPWDNHKSLRSTTSITNVAAAAASTNATKAAEAFVVIPGSAGGGLYSRARRVR